MFFCIFFLIKKYAITFSASWIREKIWWTVQNLFRMQTQLQSLEELAKQSRMNYSVVKDTVSRILIGKWEFTNFKSQKIQFNSKSISWVIYNHHLQQCSKEYIRSNGSNNKNYLMLYISHSRTSPLRIQNWARFMGLNSCCNWFHIFIFYKILIRNSDR